jgi:hypothetical protein
MSGGINHLASYYFLWFFIYFFSIVFQHTFEEPRFLYLWIRALYL